MQAARVIFVFLLSSDCRTLHRELLVIDRHVFPFDQ